MRTQNIKLWEAEEYTYPKAFGFIPYLVSYLHDEDDSKRPCILVVPGGGYSMVSPTEGEIVAKKFYEKGYNAFICTYTTDLLRLAALKMQPLRDLSRAIRYIRVHSDEFNIHTNQLVVCGFSAGGHLCGSVCVHYADIIDENPNYAHVSNRPDASILSYPVITSSKYAHRDSFLTLLGNEATEEELEYMSLEKQVTEETPPCFLWHTATDELVPVENSYLYAKECKKQGVRHACHVFSRGPHGLSLSNKDWETGNFGELNTMEQLVKLAQAIKDGRITVADDHKKFVLSLLDTDLSNKMRVMSPEAVEEVAIWPILADQWLKSIWVN